MEQIIIPIATAVAGFVLANWQTLLGWRNKNARDELSLYQELQDSVVKARKDIVLLYEIIDQMETTNVALKQENIGLKKERDEFKLLLDDAKMKLEEMSKHISTLEERVKTKIQK